MIHDPTAEDAAAATKDWRHIVADGSDVFDEIARLAAQRVDGALAYVGLVDDAEWRAIGTAGPDFGGVPRGKAICALTVDSGEPLVVSDLSQDQRTADLPLVDAGFGAYLGVPARTPEGDIIGTVCVMRTEPYQFAPAEIEWLQMLARVASEVFGYWRSRLEVQRMLTLADEVEEAFVPSETASFGDWFACRLVNKLALDFAVVARLDGPDGGFEFIGSAGDAMPPDAVLRGVLTEPPEVSSLIGTGGEFGADGFAEHASILFSRLQDGRGETNGYVFAGARERRFDRRLAWLKLRIFAPRLGSELERLGHLRGLRALVEGSSAKVGDDLFRTMLPRIAELLRVRAVAVSEVDGAGSRGPLMRCVAMVVDGELSDSYRYEASYGPCGIALERGSFLVPTGFQARYPERRALGIESDSYWGFALRDSAGEPLGMLLAAHDGPMDPGIEDESWLQLFAARSAAELERRREETSRLAAERALSDSERQRTIGDLAGGIAHDLNNLLTTMSGNVELLDTDLDGSLRDECLADIREAVAHASGLARQMLACAGRGTVERRSVRLRDLVAEMRPLLSSAIRKGVELSVEALSNRYVLCDEVQMRQLLLNLVGNSSDAVPDLDGCIVIRVVDDGEARVRLVVQDNGCGMTPECRTRSFDPYYSTKSHGRGLGLAIVRGITLSHDGDIEFDSEPGVGTVISIALPAASPPAESGVGSNGRPMRPGRGAVLVVDDEDRVRRTAGRMIRAGGFEAIEVSGGREALECLRSRDDVAVVLLDWMMPEMDGGQTLDAMSQLGSPPPVVVMSGYAENIESVAASGEAFLQKPFTQSDLLAALHDCIETNERS